MFWKFGHMDFGFVSDWSEKDASPDIRVSVFLTPFLVPAVPG